MQERARKEPGKKAAGREARGVLAPGQGLHCAMSVTQDTVGEGLWAPAVVFTHGVVKNQRRLLFLQWTVILELICLFTLQAFPECLHARHNTRHCHIT